MELDVGKKNMDKYLGAKENETSQEFSNMYANGHKVKMD